MLRIKGQLSSEYTISNYRWDGWRILYNPGRVWTAEQLRRKSGNACRRAVKYTESEKPDDLTTGEVEPYDPLIPALAAFANGLQVGEDRIRKLGLTAEQAKDLCREKNIPLCNP